MPLSQAEANLVRAEYDNLSNLLGYTDDLIAWEKEKENIIKFCVENEIPLHNIACLPLVESQKLLNELIELCSLQQILTARETNTSSAAPQMLAQNAGDRQMWNAQLANWKKNFAQEQDLADQQLRNLHKQAGAKTTHTTTTSHTTTTQDKLPSSPGAHPPLEKLTTSTQPENSAKFAKFKEEMHELIQKVTNKEGVFANLKSHLDPKALNDKTEANAGESDEEFAARLQEAEVRKIQP